MTNQLPTITSSQLGQDHLKFINEIPVNLENVEKVNIFSDYKELPSFFSNYKPN